MKIAPRLFLVLSLSVGIPGVSANNPGGGFMCDWLSFLPWCSAAEIPESELIGEFEGGQGGEDGLGGLEDGFGLEGEELPPRLGWVLGVRGDNCIDTCANAGGTCQQARMRDVDTTDEVSFVADLLGVTCTDENGDATWKPGVRVTDNKCFPDSTKISLCSASNVDYRRFCCCSTASTTTDIAKDCPVSN